MGLNIVAQHEFVKKYPPAFKLGLRLASPGATLVQPIHVLHLFVSYQTEYFWISKEMASFKPTKIQFYPKLGEKVTQDTLYWKNYKVSLLLS